LTRRPPAPKLSETLTELAQRTEALEDRAAARHDQTEAQVQAARSPANARAEVAKRAADARGSGARAWRTEITTA
jgi:hypothetical protein